MPDVLAPAATNVKTLKSTSAAPQPFTKNWETVKNADGTDAELTPDAGKDYVVDANIVVSKAVDTTNLDPGAAFEVRAGSTVIAPSYLGDLPRIESTAKDRTFLEKIAVFTSDGTPLKLWIKIGSTTDTPQLERHDTFILLTEVELT